MKQISFPYCRFYVKYVAEEVTNKGYLSVLSLKFKQLITSETFFMKGIRQLKCRLRFCSLPHFNLRTKFVRLG